MKQFTRNKRSKNNNKSKRHKKHKSHKQKLWKMKGCARCKKTIKKCLCGKTQKGGCAQCLQSGGSANALVGAPWTSQISSWPGVAGLDGQSNYYSLNTYPVDPQTQTIQETNQITLPRFTGGNSKNSRGGGLIPTDLINLGRGVTYGLGSAYNSLNGYPQPVNPLPYKDQLVNK